MKVNTKLCVMLFAMAISSVALAGPADKVYRPIVEKGETEFEFRGGCALRRVIQRFGQPQPAVSRGWNAHRLDISLARPARWGTGLGGRPVRGFAAAR